MVFRVFRVAAAAALVLTAVPAAAQQFSDSYEFLNAVRETNGSKVNKYLSDESLRIVNTKDRTTGEGALHIIARMRNATYMDVFLGRRDINPNLQDRKGNTPLIVAVEAGWDAGVTKLLRKGADVNLANSAGVTPLIDAVLLHNDAVVQQLLDAGADPDKADYQGGLSARDYAKRNSRWPAIAKMIDAVPKGGKGRSGVAGPRG